MCANIENIFERCNFNFAFIKRKANFVGIYIHLMWALARCNSAYFIK